MAALQLIERKCGCSATASATAAASVAAHVDLLSPPFDAARSRVQPETTSADDINVQCPGYAVEKDLDGVTT